MTSAQRPYVVCHMTSSVDGRIKVRRWTTIDGHAHYERVHGALKGDAWMCGRVTMQGYADSAEPLAEPLDENAAVSREDHVARRDTPGYAVALDARGRLDWGARNEIEGDHVVVVLTQSVPDEHLRALQAGGQSYVFAGEQSVDFELALTKLRDLFGIERLLVEGGGRINGAMLQAGVIDELSLLLAPAVDGLPGTPAVFDISGDGDADSMGGCRKLELTGCERLPDGMVWLRYRITPVEAEDPARV